ncbi:metallophosphoesterase family protein [Parapedobacter koreensis]|uniref:Calcineurin-like phosphoesterase n=1 Tax=Parapedobacter koreensis TaxID=332977 RepID=A0A1H7FPT4_9SPHI|nr:metallophosphoesterase [Parapedobacter koreensis]SEK27978.1 Calcineurin-like phosphoesterase [Parapedobacter koreensis]
MERRQFIATAALGSLMLPTLAKRNTTPLPFTFSLTGNEIRYNSEAFARATKVIFLSDTHLWQHDDREIPYQRYSDRMAGAYHRTRHFQTGEPTDPMTSFEQTLRYAAENESDLLVLGGDIFSYPSEAAIEWALDKLNSTGIPYIYTTGNHDWHYEGMEGSSMDLRREWTDKRLKKLFHGKNPAISYQDVNGIRFLVVDNSVYEILPEQLTFFEQYTRTDLPIVLVMHIPLYVAGRSINFGCGHPEWGAQSDDGYQTERRERWRKGGHTSVTMDFHRKVFETPNLVGILTGHIHSPSLDVVNGIPQFVAPANAQGGFLEIDFLHG